MKNKNRKSSANHFLSLLLCAVMVIGMCSFLPEMAALAATPTDEQWFYFDQTTGTITGYHQNPAAPKDIIIPAQINGVDVMAIGDGAFAGFDLTAVAFEEGSKVTAIPNHAFDNNPALATVVLPDAVTSIGNYAFHNCRALIEINAPSALKHVGNNAFYSCNNLTKFELPDEVTSIGQYAFYSCLKLTEFKFPSNLRSIEPYAFYHCAGLESIDLSKTQVTGIGNNAFDGCTGLQNVILNDRITLIGNMSFADCHALERINLPENLREIQSGAFDSAFSLMDITIPDSVVTIGADAFHRSDKFGYVIRIPGKNYGEISEAPWSSITAEIYWKDTREIRTEDDGLLWLYSYHEDGSVTVQRYFGPEKNIDIKNAFAEAGITADITRISGAAFAKLDAEHVVIPETVTSIGREAFRESKLTDIVIPDSVTELEYRAFYGCSFLQTAVLSKNITGIPRGTFYGCRQLKMEEIPETVNSIGANAFNSCYSLTDVTIKSANMTSDSIDVSAFEGCSNIQYIRIPNFKKDEILYAPWGAANTSVLWKNTYVINDRYLYEYVEDTGEGVITKYIGKDGQADIPADFAEYNRVNGANLVVDRIGSYAFYNAVDLETVVFPDTVTTISEYAFYHCTSLAEVTLSKKLQTIGQYAFYRTSSLKTIELPDSLSTLSSFAFRYSGLEEIEIPGSLRSLNQYTFAGCNNLQNVTLHEGLQSIGGNVFDDNDIRELDIPASVKSIGSSAFRNNRRLQKLTLREGLQTINSNAFSGCNILGTIPIPTSVTGIAASAFNGNSDLVIVIPYARKLTKYANNHPYGLEDARVIYGGFKPVITTKVERQENGNIKLDFYISFVDENGFVFDQVNRVILPKPDGSLGDSSSMINVGGQNTWNTQTTGNTIYASKAGLFRIQIEGLDGEFHEYDVVLGDPTFTLKDTTLYVGDLQTLTELQLLYMTGAMDANGNSVILDGFGDTCVPSVSKEELAKLKKLKSGESIEITVRVNRNIADMPPIEQQVTITAESFDVNGTVVWDDHDNLNGLRPEEFTVQLYDNTSYPTPGQIRFQTIRPDETGAWLFAFEALASRRAVHISDVIGTLHIGDTIDYTVQCGAVDNYTTEVMLNSKDSVSASYTITNKTELLPPYTGIDLGGGAWIAYAALIGLLAYFGCAVICRRRCFKR